MKKSSVRSFGIACFLLGVLLAFSSKLPIPIVAESKEATKEYEEKIHQLEKQLEQAKQQIEQLEMKETSKETSKETTAQDIQPEVKEVQPQPEKKAPQAEPTDEVVNGTLYIYSGLTPSQVAQKLKEIGVIKNSVEMELFLAQPEYARSLQKGQFELNSNMSIEEIADIVTGKSKD